MSLNKTLAKINSRYLYGNNIKPEIKNIDIKPQINEIKILNDYKPGFKEYKKEVWRLTEDQPLYVLENYDKRGFKSYHLDHVLSIKTAYKLKLPPEIPACLSNLRMIPYKDNMLKGTKVVFTNLFNE